MSRARSTIRPPPHQYICSVHLLCGASPSPPNPSLLTLPLTLTLVRSFFRVWSPGSSLQRLLPTRRPLAPPSPATSF